MDKFEDLQAFVAVVEAGSFTAAGERLDTAKSAVSRRISGLEERLGVQLLRRTTRTLNLTDTGQSFYEHAARILADLDEAESAAQQDHGELRGTLRVALPVILVMMLCQMVLLGTTKIQSSGPAGHARVEATRTHKVIGSIQNVFKSHKSSEIAESVKTFLGQFCTTCSPKELAL